MKITSLVVAASAALLISVPARVLAQNYSSFVASSGSDTNPCTRLQPCQSLSAAYNVTAAGGTIEIVDADNYGPVFIQKSITIIGAAGSDNVGLGNALTTPTINIAAGPDDVVVLKNLHLSGMQAQAFSSGRARAIQFGSGKSLEIYDCLIKSWNGGAGLGGLIFIPTGASTLVVANSIFSNNSSQQSAGAGILIMPSGSGSARVDIERTVVKGSPFGIVADGTGSTNGINMTIADSTATGNLNDGIIATTPPGGSPIGITVVNSRSTNNGFGVRAIGSNVTVRVAGSAIVGNGTGVSALNGGAALSGGGNTLQANGANGSFSGSYQLQ